MPTPTEMTSGLRVATAMFSAPMSAMVSATSASIVLRVRPQNAGDRKCKRRDCARA